MIYGYYCVYPEKVGEHERVARRREQIASLEELQAPDVILDNSRRMLNEIVKMLTELPSYRKCIAGLYENGKINDLLANYRVVLNDTGFDSHLAYPATIATRYDPEKNNYFEFINEMADTEVLDFIRYMQSKFDEYSAKHIPILEECRSNFIARVDVMCNRNRYHRDVPAKLPRLALAEIAIDDGMNTTLSGCDGWYNAYSNKIMLSADAFGGRDALVMFHECFHAIAGVTNDNTGFHRLVDFFGEKYEKAYEMLDEAFTNSRATDIFTSTPSPLLKRIVERDLKVEKIINRSGTNEIAADIYNNAYFSDNIQDVELLALKIRENFDADVLFDDLQKIKNPQNIEASRLNKLPSSKADAFNILHKRRYNNIGTYLQYRYLINERITKEVIGKIESALFDDTSAP